MVHGHRYDKVVNQARVLERLHEIVGNRGIVPADSEEAVHRYLVDHRELYRGRAAAIVRPASTEEVAAAVALCNTERVGVVPIGGNTGYCGGATPDESGHQVLLSLERLNAVREVDPVNFTLTAEAGTILADVQKAAEESGMLFPLSLGAQGSCQIGGNLATNAGGVTVVRYGSMRDLVLGLEVVLADGSVFSSLKKLRKDNTGYDLKQLFLGAEGTLGIITAAVLKTFPLPLQTHTALLAFDSVDAVCAAFGLMRRRSGDAVTSFEFMSRLSLGLMFSGREQEFPMDFHFPHYALVELSSSSEHTPLQKILENTVAAAMERGEITDAVICQTEAQRRQLWRLREGIPKTERELGGSIKHDISIPINRIPEFVDGIGGELAAVDPDHRISVYGHVGDGNLHLNLLHLQGADPVGFKHNAGPALSAAIYARVNALGGSFSAEHGVGKLKLDLLQKYKHPTALNVMRALKQQLDPNGIMNPGKVVAIDR